VERTRCRRNACRGSAVREATSAVQRLEEIEIGVEPALWRQLLADQAEIARCTLIRGILPGRYRASARLVDQPAHERDWRVFRDQRRVNVISLIAVDDLLRRLCVMPAAPG